MKLMFEHREVADKGAAVFRGVGAFAHACCGRVAIGASVGGHQSCIWATWNLQRAYKDGKTTFGVHQEVFCAAIYEMVWPEVGSPGTSYSTVPAQRRRYGDYSK